MKLSKLFFRSFILSMADISFKSRINFVDRINFEKVKRGICVDYNEQEELNKLAKCVKNSFKSNMERFRTDVVKADEFFTEEVRTCTAGGVIDTKTGEAVGFHIFDNDFNNKNVDEILENIFQRIKNPDRALLIGSKNLKGSPYSTSIFQKIYDGISKRIKNITIFREHILPYSESHIHYSLNDDTWTIQSMYRPLCSYKEFDVMSKKDLYKCFDEIKIANGDIIVFNTK